MVGLDSATTPMLMVCIDPGPAPDELAEFFMRPHYDLGAVLSPDDRRWLPLLMGQDGAVRN